MRKWALVEKNNVRITDKTVAEKLNPYIKTIVENLDFKNKAERLTDNDLNDIIRNFQNHQSIIKTEKNLLAGLNSLTIH